MAIRGKLWLLIIVLSLIFLILVFIGYFKNKQIKETHVSSVSVNIALNPNSNLVSSEEKEKNLVKPILPGRYLYINLVYPKLYAYNLDQNLVQIINLETKERIPLYRVSGLTQAQLSDDQKKLLFYRAKTSSWYLLDLEKDQLIKFPSLVKKAILTPEGVLLFLQDKKSRLEMFDYENKRRTKIKDLDFKDPNLVFFNQVWIFIYESQKSSKVFLLDLAEPKNLKVFLNKEDKYSILTNRDLIFVSNSDKSQMINFEREVIKTFNWKANPENCSFKDLLICGLGSKIFVYDPQSQKEKEIDLKNNFNVNFPFLTPIGLILLNGLDSQFYIIKPENVSF